MAGKTGEVKVMFGIIFGFGEKDITISLSDIAKAKKEGFEFKLPEPIELGSFDALCKWFDGKFGTNVNTDLELENLPSPLNDIAGKLGEMSFSISRCHIKMAGSDPKGQADSPGDWSSKDSVKTKVLEFARKNTEKFDTEIPEKDDGARITQVDSKDEWVISNSRNTICIAKKGRKGNSDIINIYAPTRYTFQVEGKFAPISLVGNLEFDGFAFGVTNEP